ncbi:YebG family protein [Microbulbifer bruguierae]|uniref:YebG family protein n=1 Tax=Microbulbifer bruguierae TaxID=3029061 RepID=A0ABY8ND61_9GAMM|nr:YebG family protein [Microbulbifer bruguierae]WGL16860.1 YebG family protein [Microbulbifer bruguierae]
MAVVAVWKCDRDGAMFDNKKDAEEHDKMLELAANITALIERHVDGVSEQASEEIGLMLAKRREVLAKACKGKPEDLLTEDDAFEEQPVAHGEENVTPLAANQ